MLNVPRIEIIPPDRSRRESVPASERAPHVRDRRPSPSDAGARPFAIEAVAAPGTDTWALVSYAAPFETTVNAPFLAQHLAQEVVPSGLSIKPYGAAARAYGQTFGGTPLPDMTIRLVA